MKLNELIRVFPDLYKSGDSVHLIGPPGIGKTDVLRHEVRELLSKAYEEEFGFFEVQLPTIDAPDVRGFLVPTKARDPEGKEYASAFFTRSAILPGKDYLAKHPRGIYVLDERNGADMLTLKAIAPAVLWKKFGEDSLPEGWIVVSTSNRTSDRAGVGRVPMHLVNRETVLNIESDVDSWTAWAEKQKMHPMAIAFARKNPGAVFTNEVPPNDGPYATPRSYVRAAKYLATRAGEDENGNPNMELGGDPLSSSIVAGSVGEGTATQMAAFFKLHDQLPDIADVLKNPQTAKCPTKIDAGYAAAQMCIHHTTAKNVEKIWEYIERLPKELQVMACTSMMQRGGSVLINSKALTVWVRDNQKFLKAVLQS